MISKNIARLQRVNLSYWMFNCHCTCKSCYEMRKSIENLEEEEYKEFNEKMKGREEE